MERATCSQGVETTRGPQRAAADSSSAPPRLGRPTVRVRIFSKDVGALSLRVNENKDINGALVKGWSTVELAVPLPGLLKRRAAGLIMGSALKELKKQVESVK